MDLLFHASQKTTLDNERGLIRKMRTDFLVGLVATGQGVMVLN